MPLAGRGSTARNAPIPSQYVSARQPRRPAAVSPAYRRTRYQSGARPWTGELAQGLVARPQRGDPVHLGVDRGEVLAAGLGDRPRATAAAPRAPTSGSAQTVVGRAKVAVRQRRHHADASMPPPPSTTSSCAPEQRVEHPQPAVDLQRRALQRRGQQVRGGVVERQAEVHPGSARHGRRRPGPGLERDRDHPRRPDLDSGRLVATPAAVRRSARHAGSRRPRTPSRSPPACRRRGSATAPTAAPARRRSDAPPVRRPTSPRSPPRWSRRTRRSRRSTRRRHRSADAPVRRPARATGVRTRRTTSPVHPVGTIGGSWSALTPAISSASSSYRAAWRGRACRSRRRSTPR